MAHFCSDTSVMHWAILQLKWTTQASRRAWRAALHARRSGTAGTPSVDIFGHMGL